MPPEAPTKPEPVRLIQPKGKPAEEAPTGPYTLEDLKAWIADPTDAKLKARAVETLRRCGPLVVVPNLYRIDADGEIDRIPTRSIKRVGVAETIDAGTLGNE